MPGRAYTLEDVRNAYTPEKAWEELSGELPVYVLYRPLSFYVSVPLLRMGVPAWLVTAAALVIAFALPWVALAPSPAGAFAVAALALVYHVLDCVDGNIARTRGSVSAVGAFFDGFVDRTFWIALFVALGLLVARSSHPLAPHGLTLSLGCLVLLLLGRRLRDHAATLTHSRIEAAPRRPARLAAQDWLVIAFAGLENLYAFGILVAGHCDVLPELLVVIAGYVSSIFVASVALSIARVVRHERGRAAP